MELENNKPPTKFEVGQIAFCLGGYSMRLPSFYRILRRTEKTVWLAEIHSQLIEDIDGFGQVGYMIPIDFIKGDVFYRRIQYSKYGDFDLKEEYAYKNNFGKIISPWDGTAKLFDCLD